MSNTFIYSRFTSLPLEIRTFCFQNNGWIVGGGAKYLLGHIDEKPRDWDILIPLEFWDKACKTIPVGSKTNSFGGIKLDVGIEIDVRGDSLSNFILTQNRWPNYAVNLTSFTTIEFTRFISYE